MDFVPCGDKLFVEIVESEDFNKKQSGVWIPGKGFTQYVWSKVIAVSPGFYCDSGRWVETQIQVGDQVGFIRGALVIVEKDGQKFGMLREAEIHMRKKRADEKE